jgi:hypothetical protein
LLTVWPEQQHSADFLPVYRNDETVVRAVDSAQAELQLHLLLPLHLMLLWSEQLPVTDEIIADVSAFNIVCGN